MRALSQYYVSPASVNYRLEIWDKQSNRFKSDNEARTLETALFVARANPDWYCRIVKISTNEVIWNSVDGAL